MTECFATMSPQKLMDRMLAAIFYDDPMQPAILAMCAGRWVALSSSPRVRLCTHPMSPTGADLSQACEMLMGRKVNSPSPSAQSIHSQLMAKLGL